MQKIERNKEFSLQTLLEVVNLSCELTSVRGKLKLFTAMATAKTMVHQHYNLDMTIETESSELYLLLNGHPFCTFDIESGVFLPDVSTESFNSSFEQKESTHTQPVEAYSVAGGG